jgi:ribosomal protein S18 acetylase RimI-like enzyme
MESAGERVAVREATEGDGDAFAEFFVAAWREAGPDASGFTGASEETIAELTAPAAFRARIGGPERRMFLAWESDGVVGFSATRRIDEASVELAGIIVLESRAGLGIGTALVDLAMAGARDEGYRHMVVKTETTNDRARAFYEARGFAVGGVETEHVDDVAVEVWRLSRPLGS